MWALRAFLVYTLAVTEPISGITTGRDRQRAGPVYPVGPRQADQVLCGDA
jgi:hypothetical protein